jgi:uncharacterized protein (DUF2141 family)
MKNIFFSLFLFLIFNSSFSQMLKIKVKITGFSSDKGKAFLMLLDKNEKEIDKKIVSISQQTSICVFEVKSTGFYAVKAFHDANNNQKLDTNLLGIPKEKWAVSNNIKASFGPPDFKKMLFEVKNDVEVKLLLQ